MIKINDKVIKKSKRPFKSGNQIETVVSFSINEIDPKKRECVVFADGSICNVSILELVKPTLKEVYDSGDNLRDSFIPDEWRESFNQFIYGQTCVKEDGEYVYYGHDFRRWYRQNQVVIERDLKLEEIISK